MNETTTIIAVTLLAELLAFAVYRWFEVSRQMREEQLYLRAVSLDSRNVQPGDTLAERARNWRERLNGE